MKVFYLLNTSFFYFLECCVTNWFSVKSQHCDVWYPAKIQIWKQFTTVGAASMGGHPDVWYPAKIQIWKQFTTVALLAWSKEKMCDTLQRYKFESNSQPWWHSVVESLRCVIPCKDTNLKAIHNGTSNEALRISDVWYPAKIQIWKQFTTGWLILPKREAMCDTLQRYKFESNSQRETGRRSVNVGCVIPCKDTNLKAIHNWSTSPHACSHGCVIPCKDTNLKAVHKIITVMNCK